MGRRKWFFRFLRRSLRQRAARTAFAASAVTAATAVVVAMLGVSVGIRMKLGDELKAYGANVLVTPKEGYLGDEVAGVIEGADGVEDYSGQLYAAVSVKGSELEMIGVDFGKLKGWKITDGAAPSASEEGVLVGMNLKEALGLKAGDAVTVSLGEKSEELKVLGFVERGGPEDNAILAGIGTARRLSGLEGKSSAFLLRVESGRLKEIVERLGLSLPDAEVKTLRQVAEAEESFLRKMELLMALVTAVALFATFISVSSTMLATVLERIKEIGLMRALGGTRGEIRGFYMAEGSVIGLAGGSAGYAFGFIGAQAVSKGAFQSFIHMPFYLFFVSLALGLLISLPSTYLPVTDALRQKPSSVLRGE